MPPPRVRTDQEVELLSAQYKKEKEQGRVIKVGNSLPTGKWFPLFFVSPIYAIPKKQVIGQPQKWGLIHNLSIHKLGHSW